MPREIVSRATLGTRAIGSPPLYYILWNVVVISQVGLLGEESLVPQPHGCGPVLPLFYPQGNWDMFQIA